MYPPLRGHSPPDTRSALSHDQVVKWTKAKVHVYIDSVSCLWNMHEQFRSKRKMDSSAPRTSTVRFFYRDLFGFDGEPIEFEVQYFPRTCVIGNLPRDPKNLQDQKGGIIFMSMISDIDWTREEFQKYVFRIPNKSRTTQKRFPRGHLIIRSAGDEEKWYGTQTYKPDRKMELHR